jgi:hypothetical protein
MARPPESTPHSDMDTGHEDEARNLGDVGKGRGDSGDLERARRGSAARPPYADDQPAREERSK